MFKVQSKNPFVPIENKLVNELEQLFKIAETGNWEAVFSKIEKNPLLVNIPKEEGPDAGKTLLLQAALQLSDAQRSSDAFSFINKVLTLSKESNCTLDMNASPQEGPDRGKSVFWLLCYHLAYRERDISIPEADMFDGFIIFHCLSHFNCNVNTKAQDGDFKDVTAYGLLACNLEITPQLEIFSQLICDSALPPKIPTEYVSGSNIPQLTVPAMLIMLINMIESNPENYNKMISSEENRAEEVLNNCYLSMINIIQENPNCNVNAKGFYECSHSQHEELPFKPLVELILATPPTPRRNKLLLYLILAGAEISDTAKPEWKGEYDSIRERLNSAYLQVFEVYKNLSISNTFPNEICFGIAVNILLTEFPDLQGISQSLFNKFYFKT